MLHPAPEDFVVRPARRPDLAKLLGLYRHLNPDDPVLSETEAEAAWTRLLTSPNRVFVAELAGRLVSSCTLIIAPNLTRNARPFGLIENVVTYADFRRRGLGRAVLAAALQAAWDHGCYKVMLMTGSKRESTLHFYEGSGFARGAKTAFLAMPPQQA